MHSKCCSASSNTFASQPYAVLSWSSMMSMLCQSTQADKAGLHNNAECNMQNSNPLPTFALLHLQCSAVLPPVVSAVLPVLPAPTLLHCCQLGAKSGKVAKVSPPGQNRRRKTSWYISRSISVKTEAKFKCFCSVHFQQSLSVNKRGHVLTFWAGSCKKSDVLKHFEVSPHPP